jgi:hypothetical protein
MVNVVDPLNSPVDADKVGIVAGPDRASAAGTKMIAIRPSANAEPDMRRNALSPACLDQRMRRAAEQRRRLAWFENLRAHKCAIDEQ